MKSLKRLIKIFLSNEKAIISAEFDPEFYRAKYPDVVESNLDPLKHYIRYGWKEGRDPVKWFSSEAYLAANPDVKATGENPFAHYLRHGRAEGRDPLGKGRIVPLSTPKSIREEMSIVSGDFDPEFYRSRYPDIADKGLDPLEHFINYGWREGRDPVSWFSTEYYLAANPDIREANINPFVHYLQHGRAEGRLSSHSIAPAVKVEPYVEEDDQELGGVLLPKTAVVVMAKNESDIIEVFASHLVALFDEIVFIDHGSEDGTREYIEALKQKLGNITIYDLKEPGYIQALTMNFVVRNCPAIRNVDWVFLMDVDEFLPFGSRADFHRVLLKKRNAGVIGMTWRNLIPKSYWSYTVEFDERPQFLVNEVKSHYRKVAFQPSKVHEQQWWIDQGNHSLLNKKGGEPIKHIEADFDLYHLPVRSSSQLLLKLNQGVIAYLQMGASRNKLEGMHWFKILSSLENSNVNEELMNTVIATYGDLEPDIKPLSRTYLQKNGWINIALDLARANITRLGSPKTDVASLIFKISAKLASAQGSEEINKPVTRLELRADGSILMADDDNGFPFPALPSVLSQDSEDKKASDFKFFSDFVRPSYWAIKNLTPTAWGGHIPFMFCMANAMRPRRYVELGSHHGASFFAYCQTALRANFTTRAIAVDCWEGDKHTGSYDDSVFSNFKFLLRQYENMAEYRRMFFHEAATEFENGSIDLLHIDGLHTYEAVKEDYRMWLPKMSERGIIMFHDTNVHERDFGVWKLWNEIKQNHKTMEFRNSSGLGIAIAGETGGPEMDRLISLFNTDPNFAEMLQQHFEEMGQMASDLFVGRFELDRNREQIKTLGQMNHELSKLRQENVVLKTENNQYKAQI